jgi:hypothetical protein
MVVLSREKRMGVPEILDSGNSAPVSLVVGVELDNVFGNVIFTPIIDSAAMNRENGSSVSPHIKQISRLKTTSCTWLPRLNTS